MKNDLEPLRREDIEEDKDQAVELLEGLVLITQRYLRKDPCFHCLDFYEF